MSISLSPRRAPRSTRAAHLRPAVRAGAALAILLAACGGDGAATSVSSSASTTTTTVDVPDAIATTTATVEPTSTVTTDVTDTLVSKPGFDGAAPTTTAPGPPVYPLTGVLLDDPAIAARPALIVKIDNAPGARPQTGFNAADLVYEEIVNDNLTRFAMVFQSHSSDPVGPIRSGRIQDINLFGSLQHPLFSWSGGNATVTAAIRASDLVDIGPAREAVYFRANDRGAPHNLYSNTSALWTRAPADARPPIQQFAYRSDGEPVAGAPSQGVGVKLDSIDVRWDWDATSGLYLRTMENAKHMDRAGGQVSTNNVVVLVMNYLPGISGSPDAQTLGHGEAFVFTAGNYIHATWTRLDRLQPFMLTADDGSTVELSPGRTFIELPRTGTTLPFGA